MLPRALVGDIKPENWFGLIDAVYAIILTLLLLELPGFMLDTLKEAELRSADHYFLLNSLLYSFFGYLAIFLIVYDIWAHHRVLLAHSSASRFNLAVGTLMLFLTSLLPPALAVISKLKGELALGSFSAIGPVYELLKDMRLSIGFILVGVYGCITLLSIKVLHAIRGRDELSYNAKVMERVKYSGLVMLLIIILVLILTFKKIIQPPLPLVLIALSAYLPIDRLIVKLQRRLLPRRG
jgi:uncharacterized membrane protein